MTCINVIANFLCGVKFKGKIRLKIETERLHNNQAIVQTDEVILYTFLWKPEFLINFPVTVIDTPGFRDAREMEFDRKTVKKLKELFISKIYETHVLNAVVFVTKAHNARLWAAQKYIFNESYSFSVTTSKTTL